MTLVSLTVFAKSHGVSRQAATRWKSSGALVLSGDLVDVAASDQRMRDAGLGRFKSPATDPQLTPATAPATGGRLRGVAPEVAAEIDEVVNDLRAAADDGEIDEVIAGGFIEQLLAGQFRSKVQANAIKENALALKHLLAAKKEAGALVELEVAEQVIFNDRRAARDAWQAWAGRFAPLIAADLDIDGSMLAEALKPYVHQQLDELGEPDLDWAGTDEADRLARAARRGWTPPPRIGIPDWADHVRVLAMEAGSTSGKYRTARVEIARGPMLAATEPGVRKLSAMVATQLLKTTLIENLLGYHIHLDPCPILIVQPKDASALQFSKERISPFIKATPKLRSLVGSSKTRSAGDTLDYKAFPGGFLGIVGAGSPDNLARRPVRLVLCDEVDKYVPLKEGKPLDIVEERQATFESNSLNVAVCSPTISDESNIEARYAQSDQRRASVECPHCGHRQFLEFFRHVHWERGKDGKTHKPETAAVHCENPTCKKSWSEGQRLRALNTIRWHQTRAFECCDILQKPLDRYTAAVIAGDADPVVKVWDWWSSNRHAVYRAKCAECGTWAVPNTHAGFQASKLYSPWANDAPPMVAGKWLAAVDEDGKLTFSNTQLALPYRKNTSKAVDPDGLLARREVWPVGYVPDGVAVITAGIDTQDYRVEIEIVGWGRDEESWSIEHHVIDGEMSDPATQAALDAYLARTWFRADERPFALKAACHDSGGHHTDAVYAFSRARLARKIWAIKGKGSKTAERDPVWPTKRPSSRSKKSFRPILIGVNAAKDTILLSYLPKAKPGPGYMHFNPADWDLGAFEQLTAERIHIEGKGTNKIRKWVPIAGRANERLDCRVYALAALRGLMHMGLKLNREADRVGALVTEVDPDDHVYRAKPDETPSPAVPSVPAELENDMPEPIDPARVSPAAPTSRQPASPKPPAPPIGAKKSRSGGLSRRLA